MWQLVQLFHVGNVVHSIRHQAAVQQSSMMHNKAFTNLYMAGGKLSWQQQLPSMVIARTRASASDNDRRLQAMTTKTHGLANTTPNTAVQ